jgi:predicted small metal-binding protein
VKTFACGDIIPGCGATFTAADEDGILVQTRRHAVESHGAAEPATDTDPQVLPHIETV